MGKDNYKEFEDNLKSISELIEIAISNDIGKFFDRIQKNISESFRGASSQINKFVQKSLVIENIDAIHLNINFEKINEQISQSNAQLENIFKLYDSSELENFNQRISQVLSRTSDFGRILDAMLENLSQSYLSSIPKIDFEDKYLLLLNEQVNINYLDKVVLQNYLESIDEKLNNSPKGTITAQGMKTKIDSLIHYICLIVTILSLYSDYCDGLHKEAIISQLKQNNEYLESLVEFGDRAYPKIEDLLNEDEKNTLLIVKKASTVRIDATSKSDSLTTIYPNQLLSHLGEEPRWYYVEFFDNIELVLRRGWIFKGNVDLYNSNN